MDTMTEPSQQDSEISTTLESAPAPEGYAPWSGHVPAQGRRTPVTTYRLQMGSTLTFDDARRLVPYLRDLGVTDVYLSPVLAAAPGSTHGYDVVDHTRISEAICGRDWVYGDRTVDVLVSRLRRRLRGSVARIVTVHGLGYTLTVG